MADSDPLEVRYTTSEGQVWYLFYNPDTQRHQLTITAPTGRVFGPVTLSTDDVRRFGAAMLRMADGQRDPEMVVGDDVIISMERRDRPDESG